MVFAVVQFEVTDFDEYKKIFDANVKMRRSAGSKGARLFTNPRNKNEITLLIEWKTLENFQAYRETDAFKKSIKEGDLVSSPKLFILEHVADSEA
ncbi:MAG: antibiotic biosynthesis monooxygenase family protein [Candidatus Hodarchaeales archaeon]|jgi:heme-degrading monooxygenase HmoA